MATIIVIGGGLAGMAAAVRLAQAGKDVVVLERSELDGGGNNARISGGLFHVAWEAMDAPVDVLEKQLDDETDGYIDPALRRAFAERSWSSMKWLLDLGVTAAPKGDQPYMKYALTPHEPSSRGDSVIAERGPNQMIETLYRHARELGVTIHLGAAVSGVRRVSGGGFEVSFGEPGSDRVVVGHRVLFADGGFQANAEMLSRYVGFNAAECLRRGGSSSTGVGLRALIDLGAATTGLGRVYGHIVSRSALENDALWPHPTVDKLCLEGVLVDRNGRYFRTDAIDGVALVNELARTEDPRGYSVIVDADLWEEAGADSPYGAPKPNPTIPDAGGVVHVEDSMDSLAQRLGVPSGRLDEAIAEHNGDPTRRAFRGAPFVAIPIVPGITFTMGGVRIDASARVLDSASRPLVGLYAAGGVAGGLDGGPYGGYVGGLASALVFGLIAADAMTVD